MGKSGKRWGEGSGVGQFVLCLGRNGYQLEAGLEAVVSANCQLKALLKLLADAPVLDFGHTQQLGTSGPYPGVALAMVGSAEESGTINSVLQAWLPRDVLLSMLGHWTQSKVLDSLPELGPAYHK
eukprot:CCRYP_006695-RA/>CCRYP_006695-RA protein AED:0.45 eAED:0.45 QI:0/-1/0/1/-1/1/1/0/124